MRNASNEFKSKPPHVRPTCGPPNSSFGHCTRATLYDYVGSVKRHG
jgi:hypothetical protein